MVDQSDRAFRLLCRRQGAQLAYTPMYRACEVTSAGFFTDVFDGGLPEDSPLIAQIAGDDPAEMAVAARCLEETGHVCAVDVNLGCPTFEARRFNFGAFLLEDSDRASAVVAAVRDAVSIPVTAKIRFLGDMRGDWEASVERTILMSRRLVETGVSALTVHGRDRSMRKEALGGACWEAIGRVAEAVGGLVPVIANGGVETSEDIGKCLAETGCPAVMTAEGALENPKIFVGTMREQKVKEKGSRVSEKAGSGEFLQRVSLCKDLCDIYEQFPPVEKKYWPLKPHLFKMLHRWVSASVRPELFSRLQHIRHDDLHAIRDNGFLLSLCEEVRQEAEAEGGGDWRIRPSVEVVGPLGGEIDSGDGIQNERLRETAVQGGENGALGERYERGLAEESFRSSASNFPVRGGVSWYRRWRSPESNAGAWSGNQKGSEAERDGVSSSSSKQIAVSSKFCGGLRESSDERGTQYDDSLTAVGKGPSSDWDSINLKQTECNAVSLSVSLKEFDLRETLPKRRMSEFQLDVLARRLRRQDSVKEKEFNWSEGKSRSNLKTATKLKLPDGRRPVSASEEEVKKVKKLFQ
uniref:tRNA-dihydrouridine(16/17) synthase [NAD(P)(+)] n=1 Tax=Chromera velia CCMP2878 TaxID=1169474 RepID=A0A0G4F6W9_9ALVE|eukprot:Cvel_15524.t1-p1 / transcript=Cvel_15524.t1 / gene=Cvel_15524 / organism=Chromera_velia_CCMP2878 / gene_product=tRNA-dihydrouridine(16/17) synthase, putative / transcript_product=tRNA-dihydrouridine(16/17) synthase, putative / location=Cvel_scaffold1153:15714-18078(+) / protein_length=578 / sequence_SO=supercontig / SO=protein_coding / is_pseudo=false